MPSPAPIARGSLDDVVMGGASKSIIDPTTMLWSGTVTTANNGGFAGVRTQLIDPPLDLSAAAGLKVTLRGGSGMRFKFLLRDDEDWNGVGWCTSFDTTAPSADNDRHTTQDNLPLESTEITIPFSTLIPTQYARTLPLEGLRSFDATSVTTLQLTLSKFEYNGGLNPSFATGPFSLTIESIEAY